jgi:hypothetical protein
VGFETLDSLNPIFARGSNRMPPNAQAAFNMINKIVIARNNLLIYPSGHEIIKRSVKEAFDSIFALAGRKSEMRIRIRETGLDIGDETLDPQNSVIREFCQILNQYDLVSIVFSKGLRLEEFINFLSRLKIADKKAPMETVLKSQKHLFPHIALEFVDYSRIKLLDKTDPATVKKEGTPSGPLRSVYDDGGPLFQSEPVYRISADGIETVLPSQGLAPQQDLRSLVEEYKKDLTEFRTRKNQSDPVTNRGLDLSSQAGNYAKDQAPNNGTWAQTLLKGIATKSEASDRSPRQELQSIVENYEKKLEPCCTPVSGDAPAERKTQNKAWIARTILTELSPALQNQLQSYDFETILNRLNPVELDWLLDDLDAKTAMEKLKRVNESNLELSPALTGLIKKMLTVSDQQTLKSPKDETVGAEEDALHQMDNLIKREAHEKYVIAEYDQLLKALSGEVSPKIVSEKPLSVEDHKHIFEDIYAITAMAKALLSALQQESNPEEYSAYLESMVLTSEDLLTQGELPLLSELLNLLLLHSQETPGSFRSLSAQKSLAAFRSWEVVHKIVDLLEGPRKRPYADLFDLAKVLGPEIVPATVDLVGQTTTPQALKFLTDLLTHFKQRAIAEIEYRLTRDIALIPRHLFTLIRDLGLEVHLAGTLRELLAHADPKVQDEALEALIRIRDDQAVYILRWLIASEQKEGYEKGLDMAVRLNVVETVPYLINAVNHDFFLLRDLPKKEAILRALGRMGAAEAIPLLEAVAQKKWAISQKKLTHLKLTLFQTLDGFRPDQIENLIKIGDGLSNAHIAKALQGWRDRRNGKI